jgi:hypothetical protein
MTAPSSAEWINLAAAKEQKNEVSRQIRRVLDPYEGMPMSTKTLVENHLVARVDKDLDKLAFRIVYDAVQKLRPALSRYYTLKAPEPGPNGNMVRRALWHKPSLRVEGEICCPHCNQYFVLEKPEE